MRRSMFALGCIAPLMVALCGCGSAGDGGPRRVPVTVTIAHNGSPVEGANVTFVPKGEGQAAYGVTDASGKAELSTQGENDGAIPGDYQVMVRKTETKGPDVKVDSSEIGAMPSGADAMKSAKTSNLLPEKYGVIGTTDLEATVTEDGENALSFDLKD